MANPYFSSSTLFGEKSTPARTPAGYPTMPGYTPGAQGQQPHQGYGQPQYGQYSEYGQQGPSQMPYGSAADAAGVTAGIDHLEQSYQMPSAGPLDTDRMTMDDAIMKSLLVVGTIVAFGFVGAWMQTAIPGVFLIAVVAALVLGLVNAFKREPNPALIMAYAVTEGIFLGGISIAFEAMYPGIVLQAVLATTITALVCLGLYAGGIVRVTSKSVKILLVAMVGYLLFSLVNIVLMLTGVVDNAFGVRGMTIMGIPLGVVIGIFAVFLAAYCLIVDFDSVKRGVQNNIPRRYAWSAAFGIAVSLVWMYLEFLRLLAIFSNND